MKASNTEYCLALVPLGGYVKVAGYVDESLETEITCAPDELNSKNRLQQIWFMSAGVIMNVLLSIIFFTGITMYSGIAENTGDPIVMEITRGFPAEDAGIQTGDKIVSINSNPINEWGDLTEIIHNSPNEKITISWERENTILTAELIPREGAVPYGDSIKNVGLIGIAGGYNVKKATFFESISSGFNQTIYWFKMIVKSLSMIGSGEASMKDIQSGLYINAAAGLLLLVTTPGPKTISVDKEGKWRDFYYDLPFLWVLGYTIWNFTFVSGSYPHMYRMHIAVLLAAVVPAYFDNKLWNQARGFTLGGHFLFQLFFLNCPFRLKFLVFHLAS